ncbi:MAG TPA: hypothetical protein VGH70_01770 [Bradyrhizobium sp.]|jgi:hypothetical protein
MSLNLIGMGAPCAQRDWHERSASQCRQWLEESVNRLTTIHAESGWLIESLIPLGFPISIPFPVAYQTDTSGNLRSAESQSLVTVRCYGVAERAGRLWNTLDRFARFAHETPTRNMLDKESKTNPESANLVELTKSGM